MPLYFFNVHDGRTLPDEFGTELSGVEEARVEAVKLAGVLLGDDPDSFWTGDDWTLDVSDEQGQVVLRLTFRAEQLGGKAASAS